MFNKPSTKLAFRGLYLSKRKAMRLCQENVPLLHALCNPGLRDRHWQEISNIIGFEMGPDPTLTLNKARGGWLSSMVGRENPRASSTWVLSLPCSMVFGTMVSDPLPHKKNTQAGRTVSLAFVDAWGSQRWTCRFTGQSQIDIQIFPTC